MTFLEFFSANLDFKKSITEEQIKFVFDQIDINDNESVSFFFLLIYFGDDSPLIDK